ncbi:Uncharacterised protein [Bordetella pertussis]|nr:Uncharacterised protein [Bordetella pertussis]
MALPGAVQCTGARAPSSTNVPTGFSVWILSRKQTSSRWRTASRMVSPVCAASACMVG